jgi:hypothetical protein
MLTYKQKWQQGFDSAHMIKDGREGHFGAKLAMAYFYADGTNAAILYENFPQYFQLAPVKIEPELPKDINKSYFVDQLTDYLEGKKNA